MDDLGYCCWRFNLWYKDIPGINTYDLIDDWVSKLALVPGEDMTAEKWEKRLDEYNSLQFLGNYI
jgi:hypothetical protein